MSMISAQIDELRERAKVLRQGRWSDGADDARLMEDAADTIWQLRDDLQQANAENEKLREELAKWERLAVGIDLPEYPVTQFKPKDLERENAKLRRLVRALSSSLSCEHAWCSGKCDEILGCTDFNNCVAEQIMTECVMGVDA